MMAETRDAPLELGEQRLLVAILLVAAVLRFAWNDVQAYSPADEAVYTGFVATLHSKGFVAGYPEIITAYLNEPVRWLYPPPLRWGYLALGALAAEVYGAAEPRALAWLATLAGFLVVPVVFWLGRMVAGIRTALIATAFVAVSPLELALGRRALLDEVLVLATVLALALITHALREQSWNSTALAIAGLTFAFAVKESFLFLYPACIAFVLFWPWQRKPGLRESAMLVVPPALYFLGFAVLSRSLTDFFEIGQRAASTIGAPYALQYQAGPPHRIVFDFLLIAPVVTILAGAAITMVLLAVIEDRRARALTAFVVVAVVVFAFVPSRNLRYYAVLDPAVRVMAAMALTLIQRVPRHSTLAAVATANAVVEIELARRLFVEKGVYDPVTHTLLEALGGVPRADARIETLFSPIVCIVIALAAWAWARWRPTTQRQ